MDILPVGGSGWNNRIVLGGATQQTLVNFNSVGRDYFRTMGTPLVSGRDFSRDDRVSSPNVAIINQLFARTFFAGQNPVGRAFQIEAGPNEAQQSYEIVGIVKDSKYSDLRSDIPPQAFLAKSQNAAPGPFLQAVVRTTIPTSTVSAEATAALGEIHPAILLQFFTIEQTLRNSLAGERLMATLSGFFGGLAMVIATIGLYGVISYTVARRRMEIGIRMALGAALAIAGGHFAATLLYGLKPWDPVTLLIGTAGLGLVATLASWIPAQRAARLEPTTALREE
jgi:ABC-type antimicrobial peptide transport system permease subunit